jgi:sugar phosphate permease
MSDDSVVTETGAGFSRHGNVRYGIFVMMFLIFFVAYLDRANVSVLIADSHYTQALGIFGDKSVQGLLMTAFLLFYGIASFFIGPVIDRLGPRKVLIYNLIFWGVLMVVMGAFASLYLHLACRALLGVTEAMAAPVCSKLIHTWFPVRERARANGVWFMGLQFSLLAGIPLVTWLVASFGWKVSFLSLAVMNIIPVFACIALVYDTVAQHPRISREEIDYIAAGKMGEPELQGGTTSYRFLYKRVFWLTVIVYSMNLAGFWSLMSWLPTYLRVTHGFSWGLTGGLSALPYAVNIVLLLVFTPLMDRFNARAAFTAPACALLTILIFLTTVTNNPIISVAFIAMYIGCISIANCSLFPILQNATESNEVASAVGVFTGIAYVFSSAFPYIIGAVYKHTGTLTAGFYLFVGIGIISFLATVPMYRKRL